MKFSINDFFSKCEKCPYSEFFWSVFSPIRTEYGKTRTRKKPNTDTFYAPLGKSDHSVFNFNYDCYYDWIIPSRKKYISTIKLTLIRQGYNLVLSNWIEEFIIQNHSTSVDELLNSFKISESRSIAFLS